LIYYLTLLVINEKRKKINESHIEELIDVLDGEEPKDALLRYKFQQIGTLLDKDSENIKFIDEIIQLFEREAKHKEFGFNKKDSFYFTFFVTGVTELYSNFIKEMIKFNIPDLLKYVIVILLLLIVSVIVVGLFKWMYLDWRNTKSRKLSECADIMKLYKLNLLQN
jgi:hypothetical protein